MRPLTLMMQAFGPYANKQIIDFRQLENKTMFVISGKTGSGKTTIFDGICFALYGRASGDERTATDLRSHFATHDVITEVSLTFTLRNKTYYIWRSPQQERKRVRGEGFTLIPAKAELYEMNQAGEKKLLASNIRETDEKIKEIIQLDANQFRQILMIPQGEFRKLLVSDSKEKELILQRLFHTELYKYIEEKLKDEANRLKKDVELSVLERGRLLKGLYTNGNTELETAISVEFPNDIAVLSLANEVRQSIESLLNELNVEINQQKNKRDEAKSNLDMAEDLLVQMNRRDELKERKQQLEEMSREIDQYKQDILLANKANKLISQEELCHRLKKQLVEYENELQQLDGTMQDYEQSLRKAQLDLDYANEQYKQSPKLNNMIGQLNNIREDVYSYADRKNELEQAEKDLQLLHQQIEFMQKSINDIEKNIQANQDELKQLEKSKIQLLELEKKKSIVTEQMNQLKVFKASIEKEKEIIHKLQTKEKLLLQAKNNMLDAKNTLTYIEDHWLMGQAGLLAKQLKDNEPCPVCGSTNHPMIATQATDSPTENEIKEAKIQLDEAEKAWIEMEREWAKVKASAQLEEEVKNEKLASLVNIFPNFTEMEVDSYFINAQDEYHSIHEMMEKIEIQLINIKKIEENIEEQTNRHAEMKEQLDKLLKNEKELMIKHAELDTILQRFFQTIPENIRDVNQYEKILQDTQEKLVQLEKNLEGAQNNYSMLSEKLAELKGKRTNILSEIDRTRSNLDIERKIFSEQLTKENFSSYKEYKSAIKDQTEINQLEDMVRSYNEEFRSVTDRLNDFNDRLKGQERPDIQQLEQVFQAHDDKLQHLSKMYSEYNMKLSQNDAIIRNVEQINAKIKKAEEQYELIGHLADIARGQNTYKLSFERYVLAAFLNDILTAANERLIKMTSGRYQLLRKTDRSKGNIQSGLELLIFDQYTGQERHVKTLSGGESFKAALALALGLADVVQRHAGGVSLETMFIDEGFGTLDPESLDQAIESLMEIQSSGRLVGIISHVPELKERIDAILEVSSSQNGSTAEFHIWG